MGKKFYLTNKTEVGAKMAEMKVGKLRGTSTKQTSVKIIPNEIKILGYFITNRSEYLSWIVW